MAAPRDWERAAAACRAVTDRFPAEAWSERARAGSPYADGVLEASGRAAMLQARLDDLHGRPDEAAAGYERARTAFRDAPAVSLAAAVERARLLEREGLGAAAEAAWSLVAREYPATDPVTGEVVDAVLDAPLLRGARSGACAATAPAWTRCCARRSGSTRSCSPGNAAARRSPACACA